MPRIRTLKPEHKQHRKVGPLTDFQYRLWVGCITEADDAGRLVAAPEQLRVLLFGYRPKVTAATVQAGLETLHRVGLAYLYVVADVQYVELHSFRDHQVINKPTPSKLPEYKDSGSTTVGLPEHYRRTTDGSEGIGEERKGSERSGGTHAVLSDGQFLDALRSNPAYQGINLERELGKMDAYLLTPKGKGRKKTRGFIVNWLNRIDRPTDPTAPDLTDNGDRIGEPTRRVQYRELTDEEQAASLAEIRRLNRLSTHDAP